MIELPHRGDTIMNQIFYLFLKFLKQRVLKFKKVVVLLAQAGIPRRAYFLSGVCCFEAALAWVLRHFLLIGVDELV